MEYDGKRQPGVGLSKVRHKFFHAHSTSWRSIVHEGLGGQPRFVYEKYYKLNSYYRMIEGEVNPSPPWIDWLQPCSHRIRSFYAVSSCFLPRSKDGPKAGYRVIPPSTTNALPVI